MGDRELLLTSNFQLLDSRFHVSRPLDAKEVTGLGIITTHKSPMPSPQLWLGCSTGTETLPLAAVFAALQCLGFKDLFVPRRGFVVGFAHRWWCFLRTDVLLSVFSLLHNYDDLRK